MAVDKLISVLNGLNISRRASSLSIELFEHFDFSVSCKYLTQEPFNMKE